MYKHETFYRRVTILMVPWRVDKTSNGRQWSAWGPLDIPPQNGNIRTSSGWKRYHVHWHKELQQLLVGDFKVHVPILPPNKLLKNPNSPLQSVIISPMKTHKIAISIQWPEIITRSSLLPWRTIFRCVTSWLPSSLRLKRSWGFPGDFVGFSDEKTKMGIWGGSIVMGVTQNGWFFGGKSYQNGWFRGSPISRNCHI